MARLPVPGSDEGVWGELLNEYLAVEHNNDGTHKTIAVAKGGTGAVTTEEALMNLGAASSGDLTAHINDSAGAHTASTISFTPAGTIVATNVQDAIEEVASGAGGSGGEGAAVTGAAPENLAAAAVAGTSEEAARADHVHSYSGLATDAELAAHAADTTSVHGIADTSVLETTTGSQAKVDAHVNDTSDAHAATAISFTAAETIAATTVQAAIEEVANEAITDHGALSGLNGDDHPQYVLRTDTAATTTATPFKIRVVDDAASRFIISGDGTLEWGNGTDTVDTNLFRVNTGTLQTDSNFVVGGTLTLSDDPADDLQAATKQYVDGFVSKSLFNANTVLAAAADNTPAALTVGASTIVGRKASGDIAALTAAETVDIIEPELQTSFMAVVNHAADANVARPSGAIAIYWIGSIAPANAQDQDLWYDTSEA